MISKVFTAREIPLLAAAPLISHLAAKDTSACGGEKKKTRASGLRWTAPSASTFTRNGLPGTWNPLTVTRNMYSPARLVEYRTSCSPLPYTGQ